MAKIYYDLIQAGLREIKDVPLNWRTEVEIMLEIDIEEKEGRSW